MRVYELAVILRTNLSEDKRKKLLDSVKDWIGKVKSTKIDEWGQKVFAYPIKKEESGFCYLFHLESEMGLPTDLEKKLVAHDDVLRHLVVRRK